MNYDVIEKIEKEGQRKFLLYLHFSKLVICLIAIVIFNLFIQRLGTTLNVPQALFLIGIESVLMAALTYYDKKFEYSQYVTPLFDIGILMWEIYASRYSYNTFQFWLVGGIAWTYLLTSSRYATFVFALCSAFIFSFRFFIPEGQLVTVPPEGYLPTFLLSLFFFYCFMFLIFRHVESRKNKFFNDTKELMQALQDSMSITTFNPNPIFQFDLEMGLVPFNKHAEKCLTKITVADKNIFRDILKRIYVERITDTQTTLLEFTEFSYYAECVYNNHKLNVYLMDVTDVVRAKKEAETKEQYVRALIDAIPGYVSWINSDLIYQGVNQKMADLYDVETRDFYGKKVGEFESRDNGNRSKIEMITRDFFSSDENITQQELEFNYRGTPRYVLLSMSKYNEGRDAILVSVDITELKETQRQLLDEHKRSESSARLAAFGEMASGIAHEINNPLAILSGSLMKIDKLVDRTPVPADEIHLAVKRVQQNVERIVKIIRGMKNLARDGQKDPYENTNIDTILEDALTLLAKKCTQMDIELNVKNNAQGTSFECQQVQISQIIVVLINNAIDAINELDGKKWIELSVDKDDDFMYLSLTDCGRGIPKDILPNLFRPFFTTKAVGKGTGLGLSVAYKIVMAHQGYIQVDENSPNTKFDIKLPLRHAKAA